MRAKSVGTFGGYAGRAVDWRPARNGLLTCVAEGGPAKLALSWSFAKSGSFALGELLADGGLSGAAPARVQEGGIGLERGEGASRVLVSRAFPAVRMHHPNTRVRVQTAARCLVCAASGAPLVSGRGAGALVPSEPWIVLFGYPGDEDAALLLTATARIERVRWADSGLILELATPGAVHAMPLEGIRRRRGGEPPLAHFVASARAWVAPLLAYPVGMHEEVAIEGDRARIFTRFSFERLRDAYGNEGEPLAPLPPVIALAASAGYPARLPDGVVTTSAQLNVPTFYGPFWFVRGEACAIDLPLAAGCSEVGERPRRRAPEHAAIRDELLRIVDALDPPKPDYVDNNLRVVHFLAGAQPELDEARAARARAYAAAALEVSLGGLFSPREPFTGQSWWTLGKTWRAYFPADAPPAAHDNERFDSEFYNGQALAAIRAACRLDPALGARFHDAAEKLYVYKQIFWDFPTQSVLTQATGESSNLDGVQFSLEGMIATAQLARAAGDRALEEDALARAARQEASLFAMWHHAAWVKEHDYAIGHLGHTRIPPEEVECAGPIDAFVEEYGAAVLEMRSFWQCTNFFFYDNRPLYAFYRRHPSLLARARAVAYEIMPRLHPRWHDGEALDAHGENGQPRYGSAWTAAHLHARACLFGDEPLALYRLYEATKATPAASEWYSMHLPQIAGPLLCALLEEAESAGPIDVA